MLTINIMIVIAPITVAVVIIAAALVSNVVVNVNIFVKLQVKRDQGSADGSSNRKPLVKRLFALSYFKEVDYNFLQQRYSLVVALLERPDSFLQKTTITLLILKTLQ